MTGETEAAACDFSHRYRNDIALMRGIGVNSYGFSIAWPLVIPRSQKRD